MSVKTEIKPKLEEVLDLDLDLDLTGPSVEYYHGCLGVTEAERRLKDSGQDGAYLLRESDVKQNMFIISSINDSSVTHFVVPNNNGRFQQQTFEKASLLIEDVVRSCEGYLHPVPPLGSNKSFDESEFWKYRNKCYCCSFTSEDTKVRIVHQRSHKLEKCDQCSQYKRKGTMLLHRNYCNTKPEQLICNICGFKTIHYSNLFVHKKGHDAMPFLCTYKYKTTEEHCRKRFKTEEQLRIHQVLHSQGVGFKCDKCGKAFKANSEKTRHMKNVHRLQNPRHIKRAKERTLYKCEQCSFKSHQQTKLAIHQSSKHTVLTPKTYYCEFCDYKASFPNKLKLHLKNCKKSANKPVLISMIGDETICMQ